MRSRFAPAAERVGGRGAEGWAVHAMARQAERRGEDVVVLSVGDPEFETPRPIADRAVAAIRDGDTHYSDIAGRPWLRAAVAAHVGRLTGTAHYGPANVIVAAGTQNALFNASLCLLGEGDEVIVPDPAYLTYEATLRVGGATLVPVALDVESGFRLDPGAIADAVTPETKAIMINSPANPTGMVASVEEIADIADIARSADLWVISDEVYAQLVFDGTEHHSIAAQPDMIDRTVVVGGLSKSHAMTGWRIGWAVGPEDLVTVMNRLGLAMHYGLPGFVQEAALAALEGNEAEVDPAVDDMIESYARRRDLTLRLLADVPGVEVLRPDAGMFVLADIRGTGLTSGEFSLRLFEAEKVSVLDAGNFGPEGDGWVRLSFTVDDDRLTEGLHRIARFSHHLTTTAITP